MRYYRIDITNAATGKPIMPSSLGGAKGPGITSLLSNGQTNPAALNIELDIPVAPAAAPSGDAYLRVWGLGLRDIGSAFDLNDAEIAIYGGMQKGLPLATAEYNAGQSGLIVKGAIFQAFGNWIGTDQTVDMILKPSAGTQTAPKNIILNWPAGMPLAVALKNTFDIAFPGVKQNIAISANLTHAHDEMGYYSTLTEFSSVVKGLSRSIIPAPTYRGVDISFNGNTLTASDLTVLPKAKIIEFRDMVGQPTWRDAGTIQVKTVMRSDISLLDTVTLPPGLTTNSQQALTRFQDKTAFTGNYVVTAMHYYGNFRQPDAASWNTTFDLIQEPKGS